MEVTLKLIQIILACLAATLTIVIPVVSYLLGRINQNSKELSEHKTRVAETYATKDDVRQLGDRMERQMKDGFNQLKELIISYRK